MRTGNPESSNEDASDPESSWRWRLGHAAARVLCVLWALGAVSTVLGFDSDWIQWSLAIGIGVSSGAAIRHDSVTLCIRCLREQPDSGGQEVQRPGRMRALWVFHLPPFGVIGRAGGLCFAYGCWVAGAQWGGIPGALLILLAGGIFSYDWYCSWQHRRLRPWCPWCKDPGDDPDPVPVRDPDPSMTKTA